MMFGFLKRNKSQCNVNVVYIIRWLMREQYFVLKPSHDSRNCVKASFG